MESLNSKEVADYIKSVYERIYPKHHFISRESEHIGQKYWEVCVWCGENIYSWLAAYSLYNGPCWLTWVQNVRIFQLDDEEQIEIIVKSGLNGKPVENKHG